MTAEKELMGATTAMLVLGCLSRQAMYGYELLKVINKEAEGLFAWQEGTLYPVLHRLEGQALVRAQWEELATGRRRKYYYITAKGRRHLSNDAARWKVLNKLVTRVTGVGHGPAFG